MADPFGSSDPFANPTSAPAMPGFSPRPSISGTSFPSFPAATSAFTPVAAPVMAVWSVTPPEKAKSDQIFATIDQDRDGLINGGECKTIFLQSGLNPQILAHIWTLCDIKKNGMLNSEQFALAFHLIHQKVKFNMDPPGVLPPDLVPPSVRFLPTQFPVGGGFGHAEVADDEDGGDEGLKKEIQDLEDEIRGIRADKDKLVQEADGRKAEVQARQTELHDMTRELEQLQAAVKQLDYQRGEAQKRLDELENQKARLQMSVTTLTGELSNERQKIQELKGEHERRQLSQQEQEQEVQRKKQELEQLKREEMMLTQKLENQKGSVARLEKGLKEGDARIGQLESHMGTIESLNSTLREAISQFDSALSSQDTSSVNPAYLQTSVSELTFNVLPGTLNFDRINIQSVPAISHPIQSSQPVSHATFEDPFQGQDPFANQSAFPSAVEDPWGASPYGGSSSDPFAGGFPPESPLPALPPKKSAMGVIPQNNTGGSGSGKQPPPRPAPPKAAGKGKKDASPAKDAFDGDPWGLGGGSDNSYAFPAFEQPKPASFATDFDEWK